MGKAARRRQTRFTERSAAPDPLAALARRARRLALAGDAEAAIPLYAEAVSRGSNSPEVFNDLGTLLARRGQFPPAVVQFEIAHTLAPDAPDVRKNLSMAVEAMAGQAFQEGRWADAAAGYARLVDLNPDCAVFHGRAGLALRELKRAEQALPYLRRAAELDAANSAAHTNLGLVLFDLNQREAQPVLERALELDPDSVSALVNLAAVHHRTGHLERSAAMLRRVLELSPDQVEAHANLAGILREQGEIQASLEHYRRALQIRPNSPGTFSDYLLARQSDPTAEPADLLADHRAWAARFADPLDPGPAGGFGPTNRDPDRRLRVGYVSADFRSHSVASFIEPIIEGARSKRGPGPLLFGRDARHGDGPDSDPGAAGRLAGCSNPDRRGTGQAHRRRSDRRAG